MSYTCLICSTTPEQSIRIHARESFVKSLHVSMYLFTIFITLVYFCGICYGLFVSSFSAYLLNINEYRNIILVLNYFSFFNLVCALYWLKFRESTIKIYLQPGIYQDDVLSYQQNIDNKLSNINNYLLYYLWFSLLIVLCNITLSSYAIRNENITTIINLVTNTLPLVPMFYQSFKVVHASKYDKVHYSAFETLPVNYNEIMTMFRN